MSIPIEKIVPGVYEVVIRDGNEKFVSVDVISGTDTLGVWFNGHVSAAITVVKAYCANWRFLRRYIPCDGEPVPLWAVSSSDPQRDFGTDYFDSEDCADHYAAGMTANGAPAKIDRGVFIPTTEPSDA